MLFCTKELVNDTTIGATTEYTAIELLQNTMLSLQCRYTVTTGSFSLQLQESNDGTNFSDVSGSAIAVTATGAGFIKVIDACSRYYRIRAVRTSGDIDTLIVTAHTKGV